MPSIRTKDGLFSYEKYGLPYWGFRVRITQHGKNQLLQRQGFRTRRLASRTLNTLRVGLYQDKFDSTPKAPLPFLNHLERYAPRKPDPWATADRRDRKRYSNERIKYQFWLEHLGTRSTSTITDETITKALTKKSFTSTATYNQYLIFLKKVFNQECRAGRLIYNPTASIAKYPKVKRPKYQYSPQQETALLNLLDPLSQDIVLVGIYSGMRISEIFELPKADISLEKRVIVLPDPKAREPQLVRLASTALAPLKRLLKRSSPDSPWLLPSPRNPTRHRDTTAWRKDYLNPALKTLGLYDTHNFHETRKTFTARLLAAGTPTVLTKLLTRHKTLDIVEDYAAWYEDQLQGIVEGALGKGRKTNSMTKRMTGKKRRSA